MLDERPNPYVKLLSINQAIQEGIKVDLNIFNDDVDMDEPGVILSCWDEEKLQYPNIYAINKEDYFEDIGTKKQNCTELQWVYSSDSVNVVLEYIQDHLKKAGEIELWNVWLGDYDIPTKVKKHYCKLTDLTAEGMKIFYTLVSDAECLIVTNDK